jgi:hypothetical protein
MEHMITDQGVRLCPARFSRREKLEAALGFDLGELDRPNPPPEPPAPPMPPVDHRLELAAIVDELAALSDAVQELARAHRAPRTKTYRRDKEGLVVSETESTPE